MSRKKAIARNRAWLSSIHGGYQVQATRSGFSVRTAAGSIYDVTSYAKPTDLVHWRPI